MALHVVEEGYGKILRILVVNLLKNAAEVPECLREDAVAFEARDWMKLGAEEKAARLALHEGATGEGSGVAAHFEGYPHPYSKKMFGRYRTALADYKAELAGADGTAGA